MRIEVLYVAQCPSRPAAVRLVKNALSEAGVFAEVHEVLVGDIQMAGELKFLGSPTIRVNGRDVSGEQKTEGFALSCRLYPGSAQRGLPPAELIRQAIRDARRSA